MQKYLLAAVYLAALSAYADPVDNNLPVFCNRATGALYISGIAGQRPSTVAGFSVLKIDWIALLNMGPEKNAWGDPLREGSRVAKLRCGPITVVYESGFLNSNPQGELGALDFPVIEIRKGKRVLLAKTALESCSIPLTRYSSFGSCPEKWAESIEVKPSKYGHTVEVTRSYTDQRYEEVRRIDVYPQSGSATNSRSFKPGDMHR